MENTGEIKYEQDNLLDKFIYNEKKAKLWAAISLLAFFVAATTVIVVAYQLKNSNSQQSSGYVTATKKNDTLLMQEPGKTVVEYQNDITQLKNKILQYKYSINNL